MVAPPRAPLRRVVTESHQCDELTLSLSLSLTHTRARSVVLGVGTLMYPAAGAAAGAGLGAGVERELVGGMAAYHCMLYVITSIVETYIDGATADLSKAGSWSIAAPAEADKVVKATGRAGAAAGTRRAKERRD